MNNLQLVEYVKRVQARQADTVYILGGIGRPLNQDFINRRVAMGDKLTIGNKAFLQRNIGKYSYDCVGLIKSFLWTLNKPFGTITYNASQDQNVSMMWNASKERGQVKNEDHPDIPGLLVMTNDLGHVGVYIGVENSKRAYIECTVTGGAWKVIKSFGYKGKAYEWTRWAKYTHIDYVSAPKPEPKPPVTPPVKPNTGLAIGSTVIVNGALFTSSTGNTKGKTVHKNKKATITKKADGAKNPYYVSGSGISGWTDGSQIGASTQQPTPIKKGDKVRVINAIQYTGGRFNKWHDVYDVISVGAQKDRVVIGKGGTIHAAVNVMNLKKV